MELLINYVFAYLSVGFIVAFHLTIKQFKFIEMVYGKRSKSFIVGVVISGFIRNMYTSFSETSDLRAFPCVLRRYLYSGG